MNPSMLFSLLFDLTHNRERGGESVVDSVDRNSEKRFVLLDESQNHYCGNTHEEELNWIVMYLTQLDSA